MLTLSMHLFFYKIMYTQQKVTKKHTAVPDDNTLSRQGKIKMLTREEKKKIGGLGGLDMVYRWTFSMIIKALFKNGSRESF